MFKINRQTKTIIESSLRACPAVRNGEIRFQRDLRNTLLDSSEAGTFIHIERDSALSEEEWKIEVSSEAMHLSVGGELGAVYALLHISEKALGVRPLWYWMDQEFIRTREKSYPLEREASRPAAYRFRGWFINDEVLIDSWRPSEDPDEAWEMAFEALLRLGGNIVIAGTDKNSGKYTDLASSMGLWITQHHSEPLGAEMFARKYPDLSPSFVAHPDLFIGLWQEGVRSLAGKKVLWTLGFRGQGDTPFWGNDPAFDTDEKRGALLTSIVEKQIDLIKEETADPILSYNIYGESVDLYTKGFLKLPEDVIRVWGDNGYGKMVSRRRELENPRYSSLPPEKEKNLPHGTYYHVSFYDLQAANHITMIPVPLELIKDELEEAYERAIDDLIIVNTSNIRPHALSASLLASFWKQGRLDLDGSLYSLAQAYFTAPPEHIVSAVRRYGENSLSYGKEIDERAGDQFYTYTLRAVLCQWLKQEISSPVPSMLWLSEESFPVLVGLLREKAEEGETLYSGLLSEYGETIREGEDPLFDSTLRMYARLYRHLARTLKLFLESARLFLEKKYPQAFMQCGSAAEENDKAEQVLREWEEGKWTGFYANDCLTDVSQNSYLLKVLMEHIRAFGDGPEYWAWQRRFSYKAEDRNIVLITNWEKHRDAWSLYEAIKEQMESGTPPKL